MADCTLPLPLQFRRLCEQAAKETDSKKLLELTEAINRLFDERERANHPDKRDVPIQLSQTR
jgi:hypothetical protein